MHQLAFCGSQICQKIKILWSSVSDPTGGAYSATPDSLAGGEGAGWLPLPKNPNYPPIFGPSECLLLHCKVQCRSKHSEGQEIGGKCANIIISGPKKAKIKKSGKGTLPLHRTQPSPSEKGDTLHPTPILSAL